MECHLGYWQVAGFHFYPGLRMTGSQVIHVGNISGGGGGQRLLYLIGFMGIAF